MKHYGIHASYICPGCGCNRGHGHALDCKRSEIPLPKGNPKTKERNKGMPRATADYLAKRYG